MKLINTSAYLLYANKIMSCIRYPRYKSRQWAPERYNSTY